MAEDPPEVNMPAADAVSRRSRVPSTVIFLVYLGIVIVNPLIAPLSRELRLAEWHIGAVVSGTALAIVCTSPLLGRFGAVWGRRRTLLSATVSALLAAILFACLAQLGMGGALGTTVLFIGFLLVRGVWFGASEAAILSNVQAHVAETTPSVASRVRGMASIGAAQGAARMAGSALGGVLAMYGTLLPLWIAPVTIAAAGALILLALRSDGTGAPIEAALRVRVLDPRVLPFLIISFGAFAALGFPHILVGFLAQDRLHLGTQAAALLAGIAYLCAGAGLVLAQSLVVPHARWGPSRLIRAGASVATFGFAVLVPDLGIAGLLAGMLFTGFGIGLLAPGVNAGASLAVTQAEQGAVAGLITAVNALTLVVAPLSATALYGAWHELPLILAAFASLLVLVVALLHPSLRFSSRRDG